MPFHALSLQLGGHEDQDDSRERVRFHNVDQGGHNHNQLHAVVHAAPSLPRELLVRGSIEEELRCLRAHHAQQAPENPDQPMQLFIEGEDGRSLSHGMIPRREFLHFLERKLVVIWGYMDLHRNDPSYSHFNAHFEDNGHHWQVTYTLDSARNLVKTYILRDDRRQFKSECPAFYVVFKPRSAETGNQIEFRPHDEAITNMLEKSKPNTSYGLSGAQVFRPPETISDRVIRATGSAVRRFSQFLMSSLDSPEPQKYETDPRTSTVRRIR